MVKTNHALDRQRSIYLDGAVGLKQKIPFDPIALERQAQASMSPEAYAYIAGGAGLESSMRANCSDFEQWRIVPRMLRNVEARDTTTDFLGKKIPAPLFLAPIGVLEMAHPQADLAVAQAAAASGIPYVFSNQASVPMEVCAGAMGEAPKCFQLYWSRSNDLVINFLKRAEACGCSALMVTLDTTMLGWRPRDLDFSSLPFLQGMGIAQYTSDPVFQQLMEEPDPLPKAKTKMNLRSLSTLISANRKYPGNFWTNLRSGRGLRAVRKFTQIYSRPNITWTDLPFLRQHTRLPIVLKGVLHPDDARKALDYGMDAVYVSNHGGRQVDGSISAIAALPGVADAIRGRVPILFDSGVRGGADVFKAIALGATAVGIGRPYCYALTLNGRKGVAELIDNWMADFELTMGLSGCKNLAEVRETRLSHNRI